VPPMKPIPWLKLIVVIIISLFVIKMILGFVANNWPNAVTNAVNSVVQSA